MSTCKNAFRYNNYLSVPRWQHLKTPLVVDFTKRKLQFVFITSDSEQSTRQ